MVAPNQDEIARGIKEFILREFLPGENPDELTATTPLVTAGILDSVGTLKLVMYIEEKWGARLSAHETDVEYMNTIGNIAKLISNKLK